MFKTYLKLLGFAKPIEKYAIPYFFYAILYAIFNTFNYAMIIPILSAMFRENFNFVPVYDFPELKLHTDTFYSLIDYAYTHCFGEVFTQSNMLIMLAVATIGMSLFSNLFRYLCAWTVENLRTRTVQQIRNKMFNHAMNLDVGYFNEQRKGDIISKITSDVSVVQYCITNTLQVAFREPLLIIGYITAMIAISWQLSIFSVLFLPIVALVVGSIVKRLRHPARKGQERLGEIVSALDESLSGIKVIKTYNATDYIKDKFYKLNASFSTITLSLARRQQLASPISEFLGITAIAVIIIFGGTLVSAGKLDGAQFMAFIAIFSQITRPVRAFVDQFGNINQGIAAGERIFSILETRSAVEDCTTASQITTFNSKIEFKDVHFSYDGQREVIAGVNFTINKGETVALVGPSGGGKSTLSELIPRFFDPSSGEILIDGTPLTACRQHSLRNLISTVAQDTILFNDTIGNNLRIAKLDATQEEIEAAAKAANAHSFIMECENGYHTNIGDRGLKLSGGQRQRLSIARAILKNPDILILDEATSALDTESEKLVQESLE
ncbi:MAG: ABC transporter ATP-binding protein, partial [Rikenellaceae bacterium]